MNLAALSVMRATNESGMTFARDQRNSQRSTLVVVIISDGELLTSAPCSVAGEMLPVQNRLQSMVSVVSEEYRCPTCYSNLYSVCTELDKQRELFYTIYSLNMYLKLKYATMFTRPVAMVY